MQTLLRYHLPIGKARAWTATQGALEKAMPTERFLAASAFLLNDREGQGMDSGTMRVGKGNAYPAASACALTDRVSQGMDIGTGRVGDGHACVETTKQHLHVVHLPIG
jgi:hypothetical protein